MGIPSVRNRRGQRVTGGTLFVALCLILAIGCKDEVEEAQTRWARLDVWEGQRIEETIFHVERDGKPVGRAVLRIYQGREDLSRFGEDLSNPGEATEVFRVNLLQERQNPAGLGEAVQRLDSLWFDSETLRLRYATQSVLVWNGAIFKEIRVDGKKARIESYSHLGGKRLGESKFPKDAIPDIGLGFFVRAVFSSIDELYKIPVLVLGSVWLSATPGISSTNIEYSDEEELVIDGKEIPTRRIQVQNEFGARNYWIAKETPNILVKWEDEGGVTYTMSGHRWLDWPE